MKWVKGGVCAAKGFKAAGVHCGIRKNKLKKDLALIYSEKRAAAAAVYTQNTVKGAPLKITQKHLSDGYARAIICNSGNANTCNSNGIQIAEDMCALLSDALNINADDIVVASTGVIGQQMDIAPIAAGIPMLKDALDASGGEAAAEAIMTTDTVKKEFAVTFEIGGVPVTLGGIAKGSGMINPNMATMLCFITTDALITPQMLDMALKADTKHSFNMICIDGDTSTNDMCVILANGMAGNPIIDKAGEMFDKFCAALGEVTKTISKAIAADGEGATKLLECVVTGAKTTEIAAKAAKSVIASPLFKAAMFGRDANWGRVMCAIGYSGADVHVENIGIAFASEAGNIKVCELGVGVDFDEMEATQILSARDIQILVSLGDGDCAATAWGCDLTYDYVKINGDYRT